MREVDRFWARVRRGDDDACWPWLGSINPHGYGRFSPDACRGVIKTTPAHRYSYGLVGRLDAECPVYHRCCLLSCVNPNHLYQQERITNAERFWSLVHRGHGCWLWRGGKNKDGYGVFYPDKNTMVGVKTKYILAHRYSYVLTNGHPSPVTPLILHSCDVRACVNPAHLRQGTVRDNATDMITRGRMSQHVYPCGASAYHAKLTLDQVRSIRSMHGCGRFTKRQIAQHHNTSGTNVHYIVTGKTWSGIE